MVFSIAEYFDQFVHFCISRDCNRLRTTENLEQHPFLTPEFWFRTVLAVFTEIIDALDCGEGKSRYWIMLVSRQNVTDRGNVPD